MSPEKTIACNSPEIAIVPYYSAAPWPSPDASRHNGPVVVTRPDIEEKTSLGTERMLCGQACLVASSPPCAAPSLSCVESSLLYVDRLICLPC